MYYKYGRIKSVEDVKTGIKLLRGVPLGGGELKNVRPHLVLANGVRNYFYEMEEKGKGY